MEDKQIKFITSKLTGIAVLILTSKFNIFVTVVVLLIFCRILKSIHHLHQFPVFTAKRNTTAATKLLYCAVCLHDIDEGQRYRRLPQCCHCFHVNCIDTWFQSRSICPLCRNQAPPHLLPRKQKEPGSHSREGCI
ncbi:Zinc finger, RING/FYVE/PHD-type [Cynara cardunculus var. scolymus]|uniref:Zinc finger, RING/FYVE/PHD-type n=1 Tax=Cynara cardunculus var. scolymus TaxID=59895 RepID=A0A118JXZ5_CYNCS|nr:Zinc finger, RING/FYVE/PHD-type [Cynara cardunculus var. scolymus]